MFCAKCGKEMSDDWKVCPNCGCAVGEEPFAGLTNTGNMSFQGNPVGKKKKPVFKRWWFWLIIVIVIIVIIAAVAGGSGSSKRTSAESNVPVISLKEAGGYAQWEEDGYPGKVRTTIYVQLPVTQREVNTYMVQLDDMIGTPILLVAEDETPATEWEWLQNAQPYLEGEDKAYFNLTLSYSGMMDGDYPAFFFEDVKNYEEELKSYEEESGNSEASGQNASDLSGLDAETLIGKTIADVEAIGLPYDEEMMMASNDEVTVDFDMDNERVDMVIIDATYGDAALAPSFHGVTLGMRKEDAIEMLSDQYDAWEEDGRGFVSVNTSTNETVTCRCEDGYVDAISYMVMTDEELEDFQPVGEDWEAEFIFPYSDSEYLTEEDLQGLSAEQLRIGRNEIFARYGAIFESEDLQEYFSSCSWYLGLIPVADIDMNLDFNDYEKKNVELIQQYENSVAR